MKITVPRMWATRRWRDAYAGEAVTRNGLVRALSDEGWEVVAKVIERVEGFELDGYTTAVCQEQIASDGMWVVELTWADDKRFTVLFDRQEKENRCRATR